MCTRQKYAQGEVRTNSPESTASKRRRKHKKQAAQKPLQPATTGQSTARPDVVPSGSFTSAPTAPIRSLDAESFNPATPWQILFPLNLTQIDLDQAGTCPSELELVIAALEHYRDFLTKDSKAHSVPTQVDILTDTISDLYRRVFKALSVRVDYISNRPGQ